MSARITAFLFPAFFGCEQPDPAAIELTEHALLIATLQGEIASLAAELLSSQASQADAASRLHALESALGSLDLSYLESAVVENELAISTLDAEMDGLVTASWMSQQDFADAESLQHLSVTVQSNTDAIGVIAISHLTESSLSGYATESWVDGQGFASEAELSDLQASVSTNSDALTTLDAAVIDTANDIDFLDARASDQDDRISDIEEGYATESWVDEQGYVGELASYVSIDADNHSVIVEGANLFVQSGSGHTDDNTTRYIGDGSGSLTGLGNLVIGYDEDYDSDSTKSGSHNLIIGAGHSYSSFGGLLSGYANAISGEGSLVIGGQLNEASGAQSAVIAGDGNAAGGALAVMVGGTQNTGSGSSSLLLGGADNVASAEYAAVFGGQNSEASGYSAAISGGYANLASSNYATVGGGGYNTASGIGSAVSGGLRNEAAHVYSIVVGGSVQTSSSAYDVAN